MYMYVPKAIHKKKKKKKKKSFRNALALTFVFTFETVLTAISAIDEQLFMDNFVILESLYLALSLLSLVIILMMFRTVVKKIKKEGTKNFYQKYNTNTGTSFTENSNNISFYSTEEPRHSSLKPSMVGAGHHAQGYSPGSTWGRSPQTTASSQQAVDMEVQSSNGGSTWGRSPQTTASSQQAVDMEVQSSNGGSTWDRSPQTTASSQQAVDMEVQSSNGGSTWSRSPQTTASSQQAVDEVEMGIRHDV